jgi:hypothetical protein
MKQTLAQMEELQKCQTGRKCLVEAILDNDGNWKFRVIGKNRENNVVRIEGESVKCNCLDSKVGDKKCPHMDFILTRVADNSLLYDSLDRGTLPQDGIPSLVETLTDRLLKRLHNKPVDRTSSGKYIHDCLMCFEELARQRERLSECAGCKSEYHHSCLAAFKEINPNCPVCAHPFSPERRRS